MEEWIIANKDYNVEVSSLGRVRNATTKRIIKPYCDYNGYLSLHVYSLSKRKHMNVKIHRLVASAFLPCKSKSYVVDHINGIRSDNRVINLRWVKKADNSKNTTKRKCSPVIVCADGLDEFLQEYDTLVEASELCSYRLRTSITPVTTKDGLWACKTYE